MKIESYLNVQYIFVYWFKKLYQYLGNRLNTFISFESK